MKQLATIVIAVQIMVTSVCASARQSNVKKLSDEVRAQQVKDLRFGMFVCWSFSTFSGQEWTKEVHDAGFSRPRRATLINGARRQRLPE